MDTSAPVTAEAALGSLLARIAELLATMPSDDIEERFEELKGLFANGRPLANEMYELEPNHALCLRFNLFGKRFKDQLPRWREAHQWGLQRDRFRAAKNDRVSDRGQDRRRPDRQTRSTRSVTIGRSKASSSASRSSRSPDDPSPGDEPPASRPRRGSQGFDAVAALRGVRRLVQALNLDPARQFDLCRLLGVDDLVRLTGGTR